MKKFKNKNSVYCLYIYISRYTKNWSFLHGYNNIYYKFYIYLAKKKISHDGIQTNCVKHVNNNC